MTTLCAQIGFRHWRLADRHIDQTFRYPSPGVVRGRVATLVLWLARRVMASRYTLGPGLVASLALRLAWRVVASVPASPRPSPVGFRFVPFGCGLLLPACAQLLEVSLS